MEGLVSYTCFLFSPTISAKSCILRWQLANIDTYEGGIQLSRTTKNQDGVLPEETLGLIQPQYTRYSRVSLIEPGQDLEGGRKEQKQYLLRSCEASPVRGKEYDVRVTRIWLSI